MHSESDSHLVFGPFRLELTTRQLWHGERAIALQPKPLAVLQYLVQRPGQLVTKQELLKAVWVGTYVTKAVVKECIRGIREALGETAEASQYLKTVGREGYRFIEKVVSKEDEVVSSPQPQPYPDPRSPTSFFLAPSPQHPAPLLVGREVELQQLHRLLEKALHDEPQIVFVTGEAGIGKTALVDAFRQRLETGGGRLAPALQASSLKPLASPVWLAHGQCIEHYGQGEAYLPVLEAMSRLCREEDGQQIVTLLRQYAPTWLVQLPGVMQEGERQALQLQVQGVTQQRMLREIAEALEAGTARRPLVLILEDLHWSDHATLEFLAYVAKRRQRMRLFVLATYRPVEVIMRRHGLQDVKQELQTHRQCEELRLELLREQHVQTYVTDRFGTNPQLAELATQIHRRTEGNALFMVNVVEDLLTQGCIVQKQGQWTLTSEVQRLGTPENLQQLMGRQVERLSEEAQRVLEVASVAGAEFAVAAIAVELRQDLESVEEICEELAGQSHFLEERGIAEWPDGPISGRYGFRHALYQNVLYDRIAEARQIRFHRLIGERLEVGYGEQAKEIASELALHFERGHDHHRAVQYRQLAGQNALRKNAYQEAISHLTRGLELLKVLPDTLERVQQELTLQIALSGPLSATRGYAAPEVGKAYTRALDLCRQLGETPQLFPVLFGLCGFYIVRGELRTARELGEQLLRLAQNVQDRSLLLAAHELGVVLFYSGELVLARSHLEESITFYDSQQHHSLTNLYGGVDPGVHCLSYTFTTLWLLGYPVQALKRSHETLTLAQELSHSHSLAVALAWATILQQFRQEGQTAQERSEVLIALCKEKGMVGGATWGAALKGWALAEQGQEEGIAQIRQGLVALRAGSREIGQMYFLALLAEALGKGGQVEEGLAVLAEALGFVHKTGERWYEAELYRLKGELLLAQESKRLKAKSKSRKKLSVVSSQLSVPSPQPLIPSTQAKAEAEACFLKAIDIAQHQQAKSLELRAVMSLVRLRQQQAAETISRTTQNKTRIKLDTARTMLSEVYSWFTEGFDTADLKEAKALLEDLSS